MNQPPNWSSDKSAVRSGKKYRFSGDSAHWRRPAGVAPGTWDYVRDWSIADHYDTFVADTPLCRVDEGIFRDVLPGPGKDPQRIHETASIDRKPVIFDFGCGTGRTTIPLAARGYNVVGIDLSQRMLEKVRQKVLASPPNQSEVAQGIATGNIDTIRANLVQLGCFESDSADHGVCLFSTLGMIQGSQNRRSFLAHARRIIRVHGSLVIHVHNRWAALREHRGVLSLIRSFWASLRDEDKEFGDTTYAYRGLERMFMHRFSKRELIGDLRISGWHVKQIWRLAIDGSKLAHPLAIPGGYTILAERRS
ncbi:MAG: class I SAM-dependent methyltransferase [Planctomycetota bacterium]|nr:class I SAM-dependent methyltransferase [Planctomycetota bacterium]